MVERPPLEMHLWLLGDAEVAMMLGYRGVAAFRRHRKALEAQGFPKRRPIVKRYSSTEIRAWIDCTGNGSPQSDPDPLLGVAGQWGQSR
jgi:hypothetical protein